MIHDPSSEQPRPTVRLVRADEQSDRTSQTEGIVRLTAISRDTVGAQQLWFGTFRNFPGVSSGRHHHGLAETAFYVSSGTFRVYFGNDYEEFIDVGPGDCGFVPPYLPHIEINESDQPAEGVLARSPDNIVFNLP